jgi:hypothetical protein
MTGDRQRKSIGDVGGFMASSARLPMPDKGIMFQVIIYCSIDFRPLELKHNSITSAQWSALPAAHIANAPVVCCCYRLQSLVIKPPMMFMTKASCPAKNKNTRGNKTLASLSLSACNFSYDQKSPFKGGAIFSYQKLKVNKAIKIKIVIST